MSKVALQMARDKTTATVHAGYVLEEMHVRPTLANITATDWTNFSSNVGLNTLSNEIITASYLDAGADPLNITINVAWRSGERDSNISLVTEITK